MLPHDVQGRPMGVDLNYSKCSSNFQWQRACWAGVRLGQYSLDWGDMPDSQQWYVQIVPSSTARRASLQSQKTVEMPVHITNLFSRLQAIHIKDVEGCFALEELASMPRLCNPALLVLISSTVPRENPRD